LSKYHITIIKYIVLKLSNYNYN